MRIDLQLPFLERMTRATDLPVERATIVSGILALRLVEAVRRHESAESLGLAEIKRAVDSLPRNPIRACLAEIVAACDKPVPDPSAVADAMLMYGRTLEDSSEWALAISVYRATLLWLRRGTVRRSDVLWRMGHCFCCLEMPGRARAAFRLSGVEARRCGDLDAETRAQLARLRVVVRRGDLNRARRTAMRLLRRARREQLPQSGILAHMIVAECDGYEGRFAPMLGRLQHILPEASDTRNKYRIAADIAFAQFKCGRLEKARVIYEETAVGTPEVHVRQSCHINLAEIASLMGDLAAFSRWEAIVARSSFPPHLAVGAQETLGDSWARFGELDRARRCLKAAHAIAREHGLNRWLFRIESRLRELPDDDNSNPEQVAAADETDTSSVPVDPALIRHKT